MISCLVGALIYTIVVAIVLLLCEWVLTLVLSVAVPPKIRQLVGVLIALVLILQWLQCAGLLGGGPWVRWRQ